MQLENELFSKLHTDDNILVPGHHQVLTLRDGKKERYLPVSETKELVKKKPENEKYEDINLVDKGGELKEKRGSVREIRAT